MFPSLLHTCTVLIPFTYYTPTNIHTYTAIQIDHVSLMLCDDLQLMGHSSFIKVIVCRVIYTEYCIFSSSGTSLFRVIVLVHGVEYNQLLCPASGSWNHDYHMFQAIPFEVIVESTVNLVLCDSSSTYKGLVKEISPVALIMYYPKH